MDEHRHSDRALSSSTRFRRVRSLVPVGYKTEIKELAKLAGPVMIAQLMSFAVSFVSTVFCGHLGRTELAGVALAIATYGSGNLKKVGVILQRAVLILLLACFPCWAILINTKSILLAVRQEPEVASLAQLYVKIFMPALPAAFMFSLLSRYLQNQGIIWPQVITGFLVNLLNALINYILLFVLNMGVAGSALANTLSQFSMAGILYAYIVCRGLHKATWSGWSRECLQDWGSYIRIAIPSMVMMCVEWWTYEIGGFLAGLISEVELGAQSIVYELANVAFMFPLGFSVAGNVRVGNALGAGDTEQGKLSAKLTLFCGVLVSVVMASLIGGLKDHISYVFTYDEKIRERVSEVISFYAPFLLLDATSVACGGIIRGAGKQKVGAICNILGYYGIGFPVGIPLMFAAKLGIKGLWTGLFTCVSVQCAFLIFYLVRLDWKDATMEAQVRAGVCESYTETSPEPEDAEGYSCPPDTSQLDDTDTLPVVIKDQIDFRNLVLRRGLTLAAMCVILAAGIILNLLITNLAT
ncbi:hypothetical protein OJAV_G00131470 [Oryzias javanicus]|uniref:Multidrug and toxin extrusion protein n=1 Tax=Oryzias javanicus TaxID=123683 RepID=A0A3S2PMP3_ORYJA|nr:hypothetical protein OJAV_G00131470 [Oryzias javanicus]